MSNILQPVAQGACLVLLMFVADAQAIIGVAPGGSVARRHAIVATETVVVASTSASAAAAANANAQAAAAKQAAAAPAPAAAPKPAAAGAVPAVGSIVTALPPGCVQEDLNNTPYQRCGAVYYKPQMMGSNLVFVVAQP